MPRAPTFSSLPFIYRTPTRTYGVFVKHAAGFPHGRYGRACKESSSRLTSENALSKGSTELSCLVSLRFLTNVSQNVIQHVSKPGLWKIRRFRSVENSRTMDLSALPRIKKIHSTDTTILTDGKIYNKLRAEKRFPSRGISWREDRRRLRPTLSPTFHWMIDSRALLRKPENRWQRRIHIPILDTAYTRIACVRRL